MVRFGHVLIAYFLMGALAFGGGAIDLAEAGVADVMFTVDEDGFHTTERIKTETEGIQGASIQALVNVVGGGGLLIIWDIIVLFFGSLFWPVTALASNGAPRDVTLTLGGSLAIAMLGAGVRFLRSSA